MAEQSTNTEIWKRYMRVDGDLHFSEIRWRNMQPWLNEKGYQLRPRFRPGWVPSWEGNSKDRWACEDGQMAVSRESPSLISSIDNVYETGLSSHRRNSNS